MDIQQKLAKFLQESGEKVTSSTESELVDKMHELLSRLICAWNYSKVLHWNSRSTGEHTGYDHIYDELDDVIDDFAEKYFMSREIDIKNPLEKAREYASGDYASLLKDISDLAEEICDDDNCDEAMKSTVSSIGETAQQCMGFLRQSKKDAE